MAIQYKNLKVASEIKIRMDFQKKNQTYSEYLDNVLSYFEMTGVFKFILEQTLVKMKVN